jgi:hypothetical protein
MTHAVNLSVYRVNWLKTAAQYSRWEEEWKRVHDEMTWLLSFFNFMAQTWQRRAEQRVGNTWIGHRCYAFQQKAMWEKQRQYAEDAFAVVKGDGVKTGDAVNTGGVQGVDSGQTST